MRTLIAGLGSIGRRHLRNLLALGEEDIVLLRSGRGTLPDDELAGFPVETDIQLALKNRQPDAVIVSNPTAFHMDIAIPAAAAGCSLLLEKPISHDLKRIEELKQAVHQGGGQVLVGFQFRFHPGMKKAQDLLAQETLGKPLYVRVHWGEYLPDWHPWEDYRDSYSARKDLGGGVVLTLCHPLDYLRMLFGEVESVNADLRSGRLAGLDVEDTAEILLDFENDVLGSVHLDYVQRPASHTLEVTTENGRIKWDNADGSVSWIEAGKDTWQQWTPPQQFERNTLFLDEMKNFLDVVNGTEQPACSLDDGIRSLEIALASQRSDHQGCRVFLREMRT
ncbi:MAG: Gfo/Idh/MocA family oxidoreductase [Anaerolineales bacterium]|nr:Gfo/Idh/MocA family oxidoreductase [Anaerolineales bacterium]